MTLLFVVGPLLILAVIGLELATVRNEGGTK